MAGDIQTLASLETPYIHSNKYHLINAIRDFNKATETQNALNALVEQFRTTIRILKDQEKEIYAYCKVGDYQGLNYKLFGSNTSSDSLEQIAYRTLSSSDFIRELVPYFSKEQVKQISKSFKGDKVIETGTEEIIDYPTLVRLIESHLGKLMEGESASKEEVEGLFKTKGKNSILEAIQEAMKDWSQGIRKKSTSSSSHMRKLAKTIIEANLGNMELNETQFKTTYLKYFKKEIEKTGLVIPFLDGEKSLDNVLAPYIDDAYIQFKKGLGISFSHIRGNVAEQGLELAFKWAGLSGELDYTVTGPINEEQIETIFNEVAKNVKMQSFHKDRAQSQSDMIITLKKGDGTALLFRVQSKNKSSEWLESIDKNAVKSRPEIIKMVEDGSVKELLTRLKEFGRINSEDADIIAYLLANAAWFSIEGSIDSDENVTDEGKTTGGPFGSIALAEQILTKGISAFIGMSFDESGQVLPNASNIFFFLDNKTLFPVSAILEQAIEQMTTLQNELFKLRYIINLSSVSFKYEGAEEFREAKIAAIESFIPQGTYNDPSLLAIGQDQGFGIMNSLTGHVNFNFNLATILRQSSFQFSST